MLKAADLKGATSAAARGMSPLNQLRSVHKGIVLMFVAAISAISVAVADANSEGAKSLGAFDDSTGEYFIYCSNNIGLNM